jgi:hypothetical protein
MVPFVQQAPSPLPPPSPTPTVYTYSHPSPPSHHHHHQQQQQQAYHHHKQIEYIPSATITPLQTQVDYKHLPTIVPKHTLPSVATTSFRQYYSPGLEYHYTEIVPATKLSPAPSYAYHHSPSQNYHTSFVSQPYYYQQQQAPQHHQPSPYKNLLDSYMPSYVTYAKQQQQYHHSHPQQQQPHYNKNYHHYYPSASMPQHLFTPASAPSSSAAHYAPYPSAREYNTIAYSVPLPPYDHSKRSAKAAVSPKTTMPTSSTSTKSSSSQ